MKRTDAHNSPFHSGEQTLQKRTGKREAMESFGQRAIRSFLPDQHRQFYEELPFIVVGGVDKAGWPWASLLSGRPGFMQSPDSTTLDINAIALPGDPLGPILKEAGSPLGLLGIEMMARRRNRLNGRIAKAGNAGFSLQVDQSFGNCPQYIQNWQIKFVREPDKTVCEEINTSSGKVNAGSKGTYLSSEGFDISSEDIKKSNITTFNTLDADARHLIKTADTFFVSSFINSKERPEIEGVDVSHRGGRPGFVKIDGDALTIPDYPGNYHFNTLGNFLINPKAGMVFIDFSTGELLLLTGTVELLWEDEAEVKAYQGAERAWRFTLDHGVRLKDALPFRASMEGYSPNTLLAGDWDQAAASLKAERKRQAWRLFRLCRIEKESSVISSFYLEPADNDGLSAFSAGQFLTLRVTPFGSQQAVIRTYTVSSEPGQPYYRISVKREAGGAVSQVLHDSLQVGDLVEIKAPRGDFFIDTTARRPAVLIGGGVGITPMISMASHVAAEGIRTRHRRPLTIFHTSRTTAERAFFKDFQSLERQSRGGIRYYSTVSNPNASETPGEDFSGSGHLSAEVLRQALPLDDYDFFLCGPAGFMQTLYDAIRSLGVRDARIFAESFGPASLQRRTDDGSFFVSGEAEVTEVVEEAEEAVIRFTQSGFEQRWNAGEATLLETAEAHGLRPAFSCRHGICGSCATKIKSGSVTYRGKPDAAHASDEVLICCAVPAKGTEIVTLDL